MKMSRYILPGLATVLLSVFTAQAETLLGGWYYFR